MTDWVIFSNLSNLLIQYYFGSPLMFYMSMVVVFIVWLAAAGLDIRYALIASLPLIAVLAGNGYLGSYTWIVNMALVVIAIIYGYALLKIFT